MRTTWLRLAVTLLLVACASSDGPFMPTLSDIDREVEIKERFEQAATETLRDENIILESEAAAELRLLWQIAAGRLVEDQASAADVARAVGNVRRIVMASAGASFPGGVEREITVDGLERARFSLCPGLYPFC